MSQHNYDLAVIAVIAACIGRPILWFLWNVARITRRWYRGSRPRRMATMRGLPRPSKDATRYMKPGSL